MIRLFAKIDPLRWGLLGLVLVFLALPAWTDGGHWQLSELRLLVLGESVAEGRLPYLDLETLHAPLTAFFFGMLDGLWGRSVGMLRVLGALALIGQTALFHRLVLKNRLFEEPTMVPTMLFLVVGSGSLLFQPLTAPKLALFFLILALGRALRSLAEGNTDRGLFAVGIQCGLAGLFDFPSAVIVGSILLTFLLSSRTVVRRYAILLFGFAFPFLFTAAAYEVVGAGWAVLRPLRWYLTVDHNFSVSPDGWLLALFPLMAAMIASLWIGKAAGRWLPRQRQTMWLMVYWLAGVGTSILIDPLAGPERLVLALPAVALLAGYGFVAVRKWYWRESVGLLILGAAILGAMTPKLNFYGGVSDELREQAFRPKRDVPLATQPVLVLGSDPAPYLRAPAATCYLDWPVAERTFNRLDQYESVLAIDAAWKLDPPLTVFDQAGLMPTLGERLPWVERGYRQTSPGVYQRRN